MKRIALLLVFITLFSCSNDNDVSSSKKLMQLQEVANDGMVISNTYFAYYGNKIQSVNTNAEILSFEYTNDMITGVTILNKESQQETSLAYEYENGSLIKITSSEGYVLNYIHNTDGTVSYEKIIKDEMDNDVQEYFGELLFENGNLVKNEKTLIGNDSNIVNKEIMEFYYDNKTNPMHQIFGFEKLLNFGEIISVNNCNNITEINTQDNLLEGTATSSANSHIGSIKYNSNNCPKEKVSEISFFGEKKSNFFLTKYIY